MRLDEATGHIHIDVREFAAIARRGISEHVPTDDTEPQRDPRTEAVRRRLLGDAPPVTVTGEVSTASYTFLLHGHADAIAERTVTLLCPTDVSPRHPPKALVAQLRAEGYLTSYLYACEAGLPAVELCMRYVNPMTDEENEVREQLTEPRMLTFLKKCLAKVELFAAPAVERVTERLPSMRTLTFPYSHVREGQDAFMKAVYRSVSHGCRLCAEAPTGIGKTVSSLYPALRAMGEGACDKIFYLTPKTTAAEGVASCLGDLCAHGAKLRAVVLLAKEKTCQNGLRCREGKDKCQNLACNRLAEAALSLYAEGRPTAVREDLHRVASAFGVCPYELSLTYAELCDIVVLDINYLFDPTVYLRRFFDTGGRYALLIDEAHNLPDRVREMYSDEIRASELIVSDFDFGEHSRLTHAMHKANEDFCNLLFAFLKNDTRKDAEGNEIGFAHGRTLPEQLYGIFYPLCEAAETEVFETLRSKGEERDLRLNAVRRYYYRIRHFTDVLERFDRGYEYFMYREGDEVRLKLFCIDPSPIVEERLSLGRSAVLFSATLSPMEYYKTVFGLDRTAQTLSVESPFDPARLSIAVMDKISTRFSEREHTLAAVVRVIAATVSAKRGHYMVFSPSFAYSDALCAAFRARYPKLRVLKQESGMTEERRRAFLSAFDEDDPSYLVAFCVMGGIYSEAIDLCGNRLIGAVIVGVGMPQLSTEREAIAAYFDEKYEMGKAYAYVYPGMNKVLQAAGRVIRTEEDRGVLVLIDDRFADPVYKRSIPKRFHGLKFVSDAKGLRMLLDRFWNTEQA